MLRAVILITIACAALAGQVAREQCFPVADLAEADRKAAEELFLKIMDSEALYTVAGGIKPMSSGFINFRAEPSALEVPALDDARRLLARFRCGDAVFATVQHFAKTYPNDKTKRMERPYEGVVFSAPTLKKILERKRDVFAPLGITPNSSPMEALMAVEYHENPLRLRGLGFLFGYPDHAVEFFYRAAHEQDLTGVLVSREFVSLPTFARAERGVVYAVPKGHTERDEDRQLKERILKTLEVYRSRRERYIGEGKPGIVELLRDWFCAGQVCDAGQIQGELALRP